MPPMSCQRPPRSQEDFIFDFDEDPDARNPKEGNTALVAFITVPGQKAMTIPSPQSFKAKADAASLPVNIPNWPRILRHGRRERAEEGQYHYRYNVYAGNMVEEEEDEDDGVSVPPHEYLARRRGASFSVHEGVGRTLKGRDLRRVRNAIWKKVGFED